MVISKCRKCGSWTVVDGSRNEIDPRLRGTCLQCRKCGGRMDYIVKSNSFLKGGGKKWIWIAVVAVVLYAVSKYFG